MKTMIRVIILVLLGVVSVDALGQSAAYQCLSPDSETLEIRFRLTENNDDLTRVMASAADWSIYDTCLYSGIGSNEAPFTVDITVTTTTDEADNDCSMTVLESGEAYQWRIQSVMDPVYLSGVDKLYTITCNKSSAFGLWVKTGPTDISSEDGGGDGGGGGPNPNDSLFLVVEKDATVIDTATLGDAIVLRMSFTESTYRTEYAGAWGVGPMTCMVSHNNDFTDPDILIKDDGCVESKSKFPPTRPFRRTSTVGDPMFVTETGEIKAKKFRGISKIYFRCKVHFCKSDVQNEQECVEMCPASGSTVTPVDSGLWVETALTVLTPAEAAGAGKQEGGEDVEGDALRNGVIGGSAAAALLMLLLTLLCCYFLARKKRTRHRKRRDSEDSRKTLDSQISRY